MLEVNRDYQDIITSLQSGVIPESYPQVIDPVSMPKRFSKEKDAFDFSGMIARDEIIRLSGFSMVAYDWIRPLSEWIGERKCLEVMCGSGILSRALKDCGTSVIASDVTSWGKEWTEIEYIDCLDALAKYGHKTDIVICSWPPYNEIISYNLLLKMREVNPKLIMIYYRRMGRLHCL